jgi:hypothetical protein
MTPAVRPGPGAVAVVLDNEAAQALAEPVHAKHRTVVAYVLATSVRRRRGARSDVYVPTAVRVEAGIDRRAPGTAGFHRFRVTDLPLTTAAADRASALRRIGGSVVDACVAVAAAEVATDADVVVLTSDLTDVPRLLDAVGAEARAQRI